METQVITTAMELTTRLFPCSESQGIILARMRQRFNNFLETEDGRGIVNDVTELARGVCTKESFRNMINKFYHLAQQLATSPMGKFCIFVFCIAVLITCIVYFLPESVVAQWVTSLFELLVDRLSVVGSTISEKIGEFFAGSLEWLADVDLQAVAQWVTSLLRMLAAAAANSLGWPAIAAN
ncbi:hypothetical protein OS493_014132 [Desmophyllum pertusum]|uniref:Uncharacterized protein n=1 Tax=Desmophyllum pertusum TaxID=174260 RepID=A0A9W9ZDJ0_9CNID|nr:hypothetical protein OS493_014132 [Desmophyllum pertusum]